MTENIIFADFNLTLHMHLCLGVPIFVRKLQIYFSDLKKYILGNKNHHVCLVLWDSIDLFVAYHICVHAS